MCVKYGGMCVVSVTYKIHHMFVLDKHIYGKKKDRSHYHTHDPPEDSPALIGWVEGEEFVEAVLLLTSTPFKAVHLPVLIPVVVVVEVLEQYTVLVYL